MSSLSSDFEDCNEELETVNKSRKKWNKVIKINKEFLKPYEKHKSSFKNTNKFRKKKMSTKVRDNERINKSNRINHSESRVINDDINSIVSINSKDSIVMGDSALSTISHYSLETSINAFKESSGDTCERIQYIKLLSKLIDLNMPSKIESSRSNEAYSKRQFFLEKRRHNSEKTETCVQLFCSEKFWLELQHRLTGRKDDRIKRIEKTMQILMKFLSFKISTNEINMPDIPKQKMYSISKTYLTKITQAYDQVSKLLERYYYCLSLWPTTAAMQKTMIDNNSSFQTYFQQIIENIETMQAWRNCCYWLNWKTRQICKLVGISESSLNDFIIVCNNQIDYDSTYDNSYEFEYHSDGSNAEIFSDDQEKLQSIGNVRLRSYSLNMTSDPILPSNIKSNDLRTISNISDLNYEKKFETYAEISRCLYGLEKVCLWTINSVRTVLIKYQSLFSITKNEKTLPLMHSYADAVKDGNYGSNNYQNGTQFIFTKHGIDANGSCCQATNIVFDDNLEYPQIQPTKNTGTSTPNSSNPSNVENENIIESTTNDALQFKIDLLNKTRSEDLLVISKETDNFSESKGLFGLKNKVAANLGLPPLLPHYLFLAGFPIKIMHCCIRRMLNSSDMAKLSELSSTTIKRRIIDFKDALQYTMQAREFLVKFTFGINFQINRYTASNFKDFAPRQDIDFSDFMSSSMKEIDSDLSSLLRYYIDCLKELLKTWSKSSSSCKFEPCEPRKLLEEEWEFVKTYCHSIKQDEEIVASSFCNLAEYLFDLLKSRIESDCKLGIDVNNSSNESSSFSNAEDDNSTISSNRRISKICQSYNYKCKMLQSQLKQAADFAKMLRADLEISIQLDLNINYSMNELLSFLSLTKHKMIDLYSLDEQSATNSIDLALIIPQDSCLFIKELLGPLITGFSLQANDDDLQTSLVNSSSSKSQQNVPREYILIINKNSKINWPGEKIKFLCQLDIGNLKQRIESSNIVFLARRPSKLNVQLSNLLELKIPTKSGNIQFKNVIHCCSDSQTEACHYNSKRTLNALKNKAIEVSQVLCALFIYEEKDAFSGSELNKIQEDTLRNSIKNSYSITFEFYRDLIKLCTGNAYKAVLKNKIISLLEKWFTFSRRFEPSEKGTIPRWANDALNFLLQVCQSRVVTNMSIKEWQNFKKSIDNYVEFIVGQSNNQNGNVSCKSTTNSSKAVTGRSWLMTPKPDIIHGLENNSSDTKKIENWEMDCENRTLRSAFSEPNRMLISDSDIFANQNDHHIDLKPQGSFCEITLTRSITVNDYCTNHSQEVPNSNKSTYGSRNADYKKRVRAIFELERRLNKERRQNKLMGFVRDSNDDNANSYYIKKAPFKWIKQGLIGQGHSGTVYKVCNLDSMEIMAMKEIVINEPLLQNNIECDLLCKLNNPSLLKYYGVDISLSHMRIFTEYCESGSLGQVSIMDIPEIILRQWTKQIVDAIVHLHNHKIVHRDVKPDNIFLKNIEDTNECHAKLGDFGVAKYLKNQKDGLKDIKGTIMYMAPEVVLVDSEQNEKKTGYNHKVDIWSLGCVVLYMVTGKHPWDDSNQFSIYYNLGNRKKPFIPDVSSTTKMTTEARDFMVDCLNINSEERPEAIDLLNHNFVKLPNH